MNPRFRGARFLVAAAVLSLGCSVIATAQDAVTVGTVTASGTQVDVPVYIRDAAGTSLGMDQAAGSKIQSFSIKVDYSPASAVQSVTFSRAGITASLTPTSEFTPSSPGSVSLLSTFQESTNPIPFTLNASAPGNQVAHLVFNLSASAAPGSTITLSLDSSLTQLTDSGGTAATKESEGNGRLTLVDGQINIPSLSVTLSPSSRTIFVGATATFTATLNFAPATSTTIVLSSGNPAVASVPSSIVVPAGMRSTTFGAGGESVGSATVRATLGSSNPTVNVNVVEAPPECTKPLAPQLTAPASADAGVPYTVSWNAVVNGTQYVLEESTNPAFPSPATLQTTSATSASFTHGTGNTRYYYRIRARNLATGCDVYSSYSTTVSVLINAVVVPTPPEVQVLPVVGSLAGDNGSFFRTSVQLHNPRPASVSGRIVFHPAGVSGSAQDPFIPYVLAPGKTIAFADILPAVGVSGGIGSIDLIADTLSPLPITLVRVFNDGGASGTAGLAYEGMEPEEALDAGERGVLLAPADAVKLRLNVGVRSLAQGVTMTITVRDRDGLAVKTVQKSYPPAFFTQISSALILDGHVLTGGETLTFDVQSGSAFIYGATTDNVTNDPSAQFARSIE